MNTKIIKIAELNLEITKLEYEKKLIEATLKKGNIQDIQKQQDKYTKEMTKYLKEIEA